MANNKLIGAFDTSTISAAGLSVARMRADICAANLANKESVGFKKREVFQTALAMPASGESFSSTLDKHTLMKPAVYAVLEDQSPPEMQYRPDHPQANSEGYVALPRVNIVEEMSNMISAQRLYQANVTAWEAGKDMSRDARSLLGQG